MNAALLERVRSQRFLTPSSPPAGNCDSSEPSSYILYISYLYLVLKMFL